MNRSSQERAKGSIQQAINRLQDALERVDEGDVVGAEKACRYSEGHIDQAKKTLYLARAGREPEDR